LYGNFSGEKWEEATNKRERDKEIKRYRRWRRGRERKEIERERGVFGD
jgi:hypothetical protein